MRHWWPEPASGDIVWCHFPDQISDKPKARPGLLLNVHEIDDGHYTVDLAYGTSQKVERLYAGEFSITQAKHPIAFSSSNLSYGTKFNLRQVVNLPFNSDWFSVAPQAPHGQNPKLGLLHASMVPKVQAAFKRSR